MSTSHSRGSNQVSLLRLSRHLPFRICLILGFQVFPVRNYLKTTEAIHCSFLQPIATNRQLCIVAVHVTVKHFNWWWRTVWYKPHPLSNIKTHIFNIASAFTDVYAKSLFYASKSSYILYQIPSNVHYYILEQQVPSWHISTTIL